MFSMPRKVLSVWPNEFIGWQSDSLACIVFQGFLVWGVFVEAIGGDQHAIVVVERPEAVVEEPMGVFAERHTVSWVVVARVGELVDVGGVDDGAGADGRQAQASQHTGLVVGRHHVETEARVAALAARVALGQIAGVSRNLIVASHGHFKQRVKCRSLGRLEIPGSDPNAATTSTPAGQRRA